MSISNFIYECWTLNLPSQPSSPPLKFIPLACYIQCIYELIVPQSNMEKDLFSWKCNISLLCKFIHQYYTLTNLVPFMCMKGTSFGVAVKCQWGIRDISVEYTDIFCSISDNCRLIIEWLSTDYQTTIKGLSTDMTTAISTIILTQHYLQYTWSREPICFKKTNFKFLYQPNNIWMQKFQQAHTLRTHQQISNSAESWNWEQKVKVV